MIEAAHYLILRLTSHSLCSQCSSIAVDFSDTSFFADELDCAYMSVDVLIDGKNYLPSLSDLKAGSDSGCGLCQFIRREFWLELPTSLQTLPASSIEGSVHGFTSDIPLAYR